LDSIPFEIPETPLISEETLISSVK
jgi:hypothetical protein